VGKAWNKRTSPSLAAASDAAHATTRRADGENVTAQSTRSIRTVLSNGEAVMTRCTHRDNAIVAPLSAPLRAPEQAENR
jgi:hypothetical protein